MSRILIATLMAFLPLWAQTTQQKKMIFLVHGIGQGSADMAPLGQQLATTLTGLSNISGTSTVPLGNLNTSPFQVDWGYDFSDCSQSNVATVPTNAYNDVGKPCTIDTGAQRLGYYIGTHVPDGDEIIIVSYSMGGLIARQMIAYNYLTNYRVSTLVTMGTPNLGYPYNSEADKTLANWGFVPNNILMGQMYGDFSQISSWVGSTLYIPTLPQEAGKICQVHTTQGYTVYTSQFLCDLNTKWSNLPASSRPRNWLAAAGRLSNNPNRGASEGCSLGWWEDGVVCQESALLFTYRLVQPIDPQMSLLIPDVENPDYSVSANTLPYIGADNKWFDKNHLFAHTAGFPAGPAIWFVFAGNPIGRHQPLFDPQAGSDLYETVTADIQADAYPMLGISVSGGPSGVGFNCILSNQTYNAPASLLALVPMTATSVNPGPYTLTGCTPPPGYSVQSISPSQLTLSPASSAAFTVILVPSPVLTLNSISCIPNPTDTNTQIACKLTGTNINKSTAQFAFFGPNCDQTTCSVNSAINASTYTSTNMDFTAKLITMGNYTLKARNSSSDAWVTVPPNVQVNTPTPTGPTELYSSSLYGDANLGAYWRMEGNANDSKGSNNGTPTNITFGTSYGKFGQGASFDGSTSFISIPGSSSLNATNGLTMHAWIYITSNHSGAQAIFTKGYDGGGDVDSYELLLNNGTSTLIMQGRNGSGAYFQIYGSSPISNNAWHMIDYTFDGSSQHLYVDAAEISYAGNVKSSGGLRSNSLPLVIGTNTGRGITSFAGYIDEPAIFSRGLTAAEIANLYKVPTTQPTGGTVTVTTTNNVSVTCTVNGSSVTAPTTLSNQAAGSYTVACTAPTGYTISSINPSATQTLSTGGSVSYTVTLTPTTPSSLSVQNCTASPSTVWPGQGGEVGQGIVFSEPTPSGGTPPYYYSWTGSFTSSLQSQAIYPSQFGSTYTGNLTVTDSGTGGNQQSRQVSCSAQTYAATTAPQNVSMTISPSSPAAGQVVTITFTGIGFYSNTQVQLFGGLCGSNGCTASNVANSVSITGMQALAQLNNAATFTVYVGNNGSMLSQVGSFTVH